MVTPFRIDVPKHVIDDLHDRIDRTRWPDQITGADWDYGTNLDELKELVTYWREGFDWRKQEAALNRFAHYRVDIDGLGIHYIHERGHGPQPMPLVLTHGWPDSFYRMVKVIPMLADPGAYGGDPRDAFEVVVPSLPGFGFSDRPAERGMTPARVADLWIRLMSEVMGYPRFGAHGGDLGSSVTSEMALRGPNGLAGIHLTDAPYLLLQSAAEDITDLSHAEKQYMEAGQQWAQQEGAYAMLQATKPQTLAAALNDSPAGLASWIVEKFRAWSDCAGDVERRFTRDELLTNITIYWATETINASFRMYYEPMHAPPPDPAPRRSAVPAGFAMFPGDILNAPRDWADRFFDVHRWTEMPRGGHFAALEEPDLLVEDIRAFFRPLRA